MQDAVDLIGERGKGVFFLVVVGVSIIGAAHTGQNVAEGTLGNVAAYPGSRHQRPGGAPQIVQRPSRYTAGEVERPLEFAEPADRSLAVRGEDEIAVADLRDLGEHGRGSA